MDARERLLEAAIECLATEGWSRTTTRRIVAAAGAHVPDVNYYFGSKDRLMHEAAVQVARRWARGPIEDGSGDSDREVGQALLRALADFLASMEADRSVVVTAVETFAQVERSDRLRAELAAAYEDFRRGVVRRFSAFDGGRDDAQTQAVAFVLIALFDGLALQWLLDSGAVPSPAVIIDALARIGGLVARDRG